MPPYANDSSSSEPVMYQVDCNVASTGKTVSATKRTVRWSYGFANMETMSAGTTGVNCRGSEHELTLIWSLTSGKKKVLHDGREIHFSQGRRAEAKFQFQFFVGNHVFTILAHAAPPLGKKAHNWKQFELMVDGCSFSKLTKIFELGMAKRGRKDQRGYGNSSSTGNSQSLHAHTSARAAFRPMDDNLNGKQQNQYPSSQALEYRSPLGMEAPHYNASPSDYSVDMRNQMGIYREDSLRSFDSTPTVTTARAPPSPIDLLSQDHITINGSQQDLLSAPAPVDIYLGSTATAAPSSNPIEFQQNDEFNPRPNPEMVWSNIMNAYDQTSNNENMQPIGGTTAEVVMPAMNSLHIDTSVNKSHLAGFFTEEPIESPTDVAAIDRGLKNLVNLDNINASVFGTYTKEDSVKNKAEKENRYLSLAEIKSKTTRVNSNTREIMKTHAVQAQHTPGAMVVYGEPVLMGGQQQQIYGQGPPPLAFGVGYSTY
mmetsp:Transcript_23116/g.34268  ORF Transcript_23116/g.34268 Transcript_23116/m.34268 type:complete len:484 (-) Transcript_23116:153-1604(-)